MRDCNVLAIVHTYTTAIMHILFIILVSIFYAITACGRGCSAKLTGHKVQQVIPVTENLWATALT